MQQLLKAHTTVRDIREHQSQVKQDLDSSYRAKGFGSSDSLEQVLENESDSEKLAAKKEKQAAASPVPKLTPVRVSPLSFEENAPTHLKKEADDQVLCDFLGEEQMKKLSLLGKYDQQSNAEAEPQPEPNITSKLQQSSSIPPYKRPASTDPAVGHAKMEYMTEATPQESRNSVLFEMQMLRQKLQLTAIEELAAIDKEFDVTPTSISADEDTNSYRYSILNQMEEILGPISPRRQSGHVRQSSEPVGSASFSREQSKRLYTQEEAARMGYKVFAQVNNGHLPQSKTPPVMRSAQAASQPIYHSLRRPSKSKPKIEMTRTSSGGLPLADSIDQHSADVKSVVHYDTAVVKKRKSHTGTLEKPRHPLQYSVESLNEEVAAESGSSSSHGPGPSSSTGYSFGDDDGIEHKGIGSSCKTKTDSLPNYAKASRPKLETKLSAPTWNQTYSADVYPETGSSSPEIKPYMTTGQAHAEMDEFLSRTESEKFVYKPYSQLKSQPSRPGSAPLKKHAVNAHSSNRTFL